MCAVGGGGACVRAPALGDVAERGADLALKHLQRQCMCMYAKFRHSNGLWHEH